jgi:phosphate transport system protein
MTPAHTDREYEAELVRLRQQIVDMGAKVDEMLSMSMCTLVERRTDLASQVIELDHQVNRLEVETDGLCMRVLARRQPVASDLRFITSALKLVTDLERIGDLAVNICERAIELNEAPPHEPCVDLPAMSQAAQSMVRDALGAFVHSDADRARDVIERDRVVDAYYAQIFRGLLECMMQDPRSVFGATRVQSVAKYLERIADHATNLAEMVVFMVVRQDIRHQGKLGEPAAPHPPRGILFLCGDNSARSQIAEGWARKLLGPSQRIHSAGSAPAAAVHPCAIDVMREAGVDIASAKPKAISDVPLAEVDLVVTVCAEEVCPILPGSIQREHWALPDPAAVFGNDLEVKAAFRATRDSIRERMEILAKQWH